MEISDVVVFGLAGLEAIYIINNIFQMIYKIDENRLQLQK